MLKLNVFVFNVFVASQSLFPISFTIHAFINVQMTTCYWATDVVF